MADSRKLAKVVPIHRGTPTTTTTTTSTKADGQPAGIPTCQRAWIESDKCSRPKATESEQEPFLGSSTSPSTSDSSETSSLESERLCHDAPAQKKARIFSIDLERGKKGGGAMVGLPHHRSTKTNDRRKRKGTGSDVPTTATKLLQFCQCCPWAVPWSLLFVSALQITVFTIKNDTIYWALIFSPLKQHQIWRFVTYTFLHAGCVHLVLNIIIQLLVAFPLETEQGHRRVLLVYFTGVLAGGLGASVFEPTLMVGASAGVYCLLMSHIPHIIMNFRALSYRYYRLLAVLVLCISDVLYSIRHCLTKGNLQPRIGVAAHVSGALCGLVIGFVFFRPIVAPESTRLQVVFRLLRYLGATLAIAWIVFTLLYNLDRTNVIELL
ncbi:protein rhomboid-like [Anopheles albimanus]|uniref:Rhomboid-like protein n=1 Tax=Anopheles albimanus TaxID=7167 RepID=A0A182F5A1_ANOAL|nr:protein rhomboid-like [Anopheles albimanus]XP_035775347.1 protein rhomboid-like [Anopheles albimanus]